VVNISEEIDFDLLEMIEEAKTSENYAFVDWDKLQKEVKLYENFEAEVVRPEMAKELTKVEPETDGPKIKRKISMKKAITVTEGTDNSNTLATLTHNEEMI
jgi:hypothetical protein